MVRRTLKVLTAKISGLREAAFWLSVFALFSQILALFRDRLLAHNFGVGTALDVYYAGFKVPDMIFVTVASLVSISALVPLFAKKETEGEKHLKDATESIFTVFSVVIILSCALAYFLMPFIVSKAFGGLSLSAQEQTILFSRILLLSPLLLGFSNFFGSIVQYEKRFILYSLSPLLYNAGIIAGIFFLSSRYGVASAVIGVIVGAVLHLSLQAVFIMSSPLKPKFTLNIKWDDVFETARLSVPRTLALSMVSFVGFFFVALAAYMVTGSIAIFNFSWNLQSAPVSLIGVSFSLAAFPAIAISAARKEMGEVVDRISDGLKQIIFWSLPFSALIIILRAHIVRIVLGSGVFDWSATRLVAASLAMFAVSLVFQNMQLFLSRSHYALGKTKWTLISNILGGSVSVISAILFLKYFDEFRPVFDLFARVLKIEDLSYQILVLPVAFSFGAIISAALLFVALGTGLRKEIWRKIKKSILKVFVSAYVAGAGTYYALAVFDKFFSLEKFWGVLGHAFVSGIFGIALGAISLYLMKSEEFMEVFDKLKRRF